MAGKLVYKEGHAFGDFNPGQSDALQAAIRTEMRRLLTEAFRAYADEGSWYESEGDPWWSPSGLDGTYWLDQFPVDLTITPAEFIAAFSQCDCTDPDIRARLLEWRQAIDQLLAPNDTQPA